MCIRDRSDEHKIFTENIFIVCFQPVSYTHLDVYKRQVYTQYGNQPDTLSPKLVNERDAGQTVSRVIMSFRVFEHKPTVA